MPKPHPKEFRDDVVAVARKGEAPIAEIANDFGISESCLRNWLTKADIDDGRRPGVTAAESVERLRNWASGRCLSATRAGIYVRGNDIPPTGGRRVTRASSN